MSKDLVRQALDLDDRLSAPARGKHSKVITKSMKKKERRKKAKSRVTGQKGQGELSLVERNVEVLLKNAKKFEPKRRVIKKLADRQVPKWQLAPKKKKKKKEDKIPDSAYDISDVLL